MLKQEPLQLGVFLYVHRSIHKFAIINLNELIDYYELVKGNKIFSMLEQIYKCLENALFSKKQLEERVLELEKRLEEMQKLNEIYFTEYLKKLYDYELLRTTHVKLLDHYSENKINQ